MNKSGSGNRATFVSPYLRRPLRPLKKVLNDHQDGAEGVDQEAAEDLDSDASAAHWLGSHKRAVVSD